MNTLQCTLDVARYVMENGPQPPVPRLEKPRNRTRDVRTPGRKWSKHDGEHSHRRKHPREQMVRRAIPSQGSESLTVHRLPQGTTCKQVLHVMRKKSKLAPNKVSPVP